MASSCILRCSRNSGQIIGSAAVAEMIERTDHLETLNLSWNQLRPTGCARVIRALTENQTLHRLGLAWNGAGSSVMLLEQVLSGDGSELVEIDISSNSIGEREAQVRLSALTPQQPPKQPFNWPKP